MKFVLSLSLLKRNRNFRLLYIGQFVSMIGTMITSVAVPYQIYQATKSTLMVGLVSLFQLIPLLFTALAGGVLADRKHRKMLLIVAESLLALASIVMIANAYSADMKIWIVFAVASFMAAMTGLHRPALESMVQQIVAKEDFIHVGVLSSFKTSLCVIAGPAIGGLLIASFGLVVTYSVDLATFVISLTALALISGVKKPEPKKDQTALSALAEGMRYAWARQELVGSYLVDFLAMIFGMPQALFPAIADHYGSTKVLGMLYAAPAVGALLISFFSGWTHNVKRHGAAIALAAIGWGFAIIAFGLSPYAWMALFFLSVAGAFDEISAIFRVTLWNQTIDNNYRGRLAGIEMISYMSGPKLGDTEAGLVAAAFGVTASVVSGGVLCVVGVAASCYFLPKFWRYKS